VFGHILYCSAIWMTHSTISALIYCVNGYSSICGAYICAGYSIYVTILGLESLIGDGHEMHEQVDLAAELSLEY